MASMPTGDTVPYSGSRSVLLSRLRTLPRALAGESVPGAAIARTVWRAVAIEMLTILKEAFVEKGRGGTDGAGITWAPLSPRTIAYQRRQPGLNSKRSRAAKAGRASRPLLTAAQDKLWRSTYAQVLARFTKAGSPTASGNAAAVAWAAVKAAGGKTIIGEYGNAKVEIGRDTGRLLNSLSPGSRDNLLSTERGLVRVGTNVEYAEHFHAKRPLWPENTLPQAWLDRLAAVAAAALKLAVSQLQIVKAY